MSKILDILTDEYFDWLCHIVSRKNGGRILSYKKLLYHLFNTDFIYTIEMDGNRAEDGINLRYQFGQENEYDQRIIASCLDIMPCSVLEMMIALAIRQEDIMEDPKYGDRTSQWFWEMIDSLGLIFMDDSRFDTHHVDSIIQIFLNREYRKDGKGGLFTIKRCKYDLRHVDIWYQMNWYLNTII